MGTRVDMWQMQAYEPRELIEPDNMVVVILQDVVTRAITEKAMKFQSVGRLLQMSRKLQAANGNFRFVAIRSYKDANCDTTE